MSDGEDPAESSPRQLRHRPSLGGKTDPILELEAQSLRDQAQVQLDEPEFERIVGRDHRPPRLSKLLGRAGVVAGLVSVLGVLVLLRSRPDAGTPETLDPPAHGITAHTAREVAELFLQAVTPEERTKWMRQRPGLDERIPQFAEAARTYPVLYRELIKIGPANTVDGLGYMRFAVGMEDDTRRLLCVVSTDRGWQVDWECFARYSSTTWEELRTGPVSQAEVRVTARPVASYQFEFADEDRWQSFALTSPDWEEPVYGYAARDSIASKILHRTTRGKGAGQRVTLTVSTSSDPLHRQLRIHRVIAIGWVAGPRDVQDVFPNIEARY